MRNDFQNPYYPYHKEVDALTFRGAETIPYQILMYLLDLPDAEGYFPIDDNSRPRVRLAKYLWYDEAFPLDQPLPTPEQKRSMLFDPREPAGNTDAEKAAHPKGYRLLWQRMSGNSQLDAQTVLKCFIGPVDEPRKFMARVGIRFEIWVSVLLETNTRTSAYQRSYDMEQALIEALDGVNMTGIGTISFCRGDQSENGSRPIWDQVTNVGREVNFSISWAEGPDRREVDDW